LARSREKRTNQRDRKDIARYPAPGIFGQRPPAANAANIAIANAATANQRDPSFSFNDLTDICSLQVFAGFPSPTCESTKTKDSLTSEKRDCR
jgi:hypothetical protein